MKPRRRKPDPVLMGVPSPSLAKMSKMNMVDLNAQIDRLTIEGSRLASKIERLTVHKPSPVEHITQLKAQLERLEVLKKAAQERLAAKDERRLRRDPPYR